MKALATSDRLGLQRYVSQQMQCSLAVRDIEHEIIPAALDQGVGTLVWSPLAQGYLTGKYHGEDGEGRLTASGNLAGVDTARSRATVGTLREVANARDGVSPARSRSPGCCGVRASARFWSVRGPTSNSPTISPPARSGSATRR